MNPYALNERWTQQYTLKLYALLCQKGWLSEAEKTRFKPSMESLAGLGKKESYDISQTCVWAMENFLWLTLDKMDERKLLNHTAGGVTQRSEYEVFSENLLRNKRAFPYRVFWAIIAKSQAMSAWPDASEREKSKIIRQMIQVEQGQTGLTKWLDRFANFMENITVNTDDLGHFSKGDLYPRWTPDYALENTH